MFQYHRKVARRAKMAIYSPPEAKISLHSGIITVSRALSEADDSPKYTTVYCSPAACYHGDLIKAASDAASPKVGAMYTSPSGCWGGGTHLTTPEGLSKF